MTQVEVEAEKWLTAGKTWTLYQVILQNPKWDSNLMTIGRLGLAEAWGSLKSMRFNQDKTAFSCAFQVNRHPKPFQLGGEYIQIFFDLPTRDFNCLE